MTSDGRRYPLPSEELVHRVTGDGDPMRFLELGEQSARQIERALGAVGRSLEDFESILDWGCGCGRVIRWLDGFAARACLHGVDIDEHAITWCRQNLPFATFSVCQPKPPLEFPDGHFDLVFNHSVLTHLDERFQDLWLAELRRVTRLGGMVILSVHGDHAFSVTEEAERTAGVDPQPWREQLERDGILFVADDVHIGGAFPDFYHSTFHAPWYVLSHWARYFNVRAYLPRADLDFQDIVVLERVTDAELAVPIHATPNGRAGGVSATDRTAPSAQPVQRAEELITHGPDVGGPARLGAASHLVRRVVRRLTRFGEQHQQRIDQALLEAVREKTDPPRLEPLIQAIKQQGDRLNRLEREARAEMAGIWKAVEERRSDRPGDSR